MTKFYEYLGKTIIVAVTVMVVAFGLAMLLAFPVKWLWNWLMPTLFGLRTINVWQAWGLNVLCGLLFKSSSTSAK